MPESKRSKFSTDKIFRKKGSIFGVGITSNRKKDLLTKISKYLTKMRQSEAKLPLFITTPNPEQALLAKNDAKFREILQKSDISLCDGVGLLAAYDFQKQIKDKKDEKIQTASRFNLFFKSLIFVLKKRKTSDGLRIIKGRNFFYDLLQIADKRSYKVFLLGSSRRVLRRTIVRLSKKYPAVHFKTYHGARLDSNSVPLTDKEIRRDEKSMLLINRFQPDMLFVAFGAPKQEKWVYQNLDKLKASLIMVCGSTFEYIAGTRKYVPLRIENLGLEWLWRLLTGSQKIDRVINAAFKFPYSIVKEL